MKQVTCIKLRKYQYLPHERIEGIGGSGWYAPEPVAIDQMEAGTELYYALVDGHQTPLTVAHYFGRKYLKTELDTYSPDHLLNLPECA